MKDMEKRKRVMARSMQLGHCICDPKKPCPCNVFKAEDVCPCAGESLPLPAGPVRLTELVDRPGCASKIDEAMLSLLAQAEFDAVIGVRDAEERAAARCRGNAPQRCDIDIDAAMRERL